ncbi:MAG: very short patch repair endonuclease [Methylocystaceae bacterium]|nr:MAG: very short patch repair endonuclease [Methylocystaceae bacterium]
MDILTKEQRSEVMSMIRAQDTGPELVVRRAAHALGLRFRLHRRDLAGSPDLVFPRRRKALFVHGCYWHRHEGCRFAYTPKSNVDFWMTKFARNVERDNEAMARLRVAGWDPMVIWECETRQPERVVERLSAIIEAA